MEWSSPGGQTVSRAMPWPVEVFAWRQGLTGRFVHSLFRLVSDDTSFMSDLDKEVENRPVVFHPKRRNSVANGPTN
jgi:hypothetical protein